MRRLNNETKLRLSKANPELHKNIYEEEDVLKSYRFFFGCEPGEADSVTGTYAKLTEVLNKGEDFGESDNLFGLYDGYRTSSYMLMVTAMWQGSFTDHVLNSIGKCDFDVYPKDDPEKCSENFVLSFQSKCTKTEQFPLEITLKNGQKYDLAGVIYGDTVHATATVTNS